jgi:hypothetical protein
MTKKMTLSSRCQLPSRLGSSGPVLCRPRPSISPRPPPIAPPVLLNTLQLNPPHYSRPPASTLPRYNPLHSPHRRNHRLWHSTPSTTPFARTSSCHKASRNAYHSRCQYLFVTGSKICHSTGYVMLPVELPRLPKTTLPWNALPKTQRKTLRRLRRSRRLRHRLATRIQTQPLPCWHQTPLGHARTSSRREPKLSPCSSTGSNSESSGGSWVLCSITRASLVVC